MAIVSEFTDEEPQDIGTLLKGLRIPSNFARHEILEDEDTIAQLGEYLRSIPGRWRLDIGGHACLIIWQAHHIRHHRKVT